MLFPSAGSATWQMAIYFFLHKALKLFFKILKNLKNSGQYFHLFSLSFSMRLSTDLVASFLCIPLSPLFLMIQIKPLLPPPFLAGLKWAESGSTTSHFRCNNTMHTVRKVLAEFAVCNWWRYCKAVCDVKFSQIEGNGKKCRRIELSNSVIRLIFLKVQLAASLGGGQMYCIESIFF